ncbi:3-oxoacyl-[acyl-carrier-protein] synthase-3 [Catalinimonas alkaloidigena]|uniref:3-oxoacyl-ACP synthase III family protein n=1 Tax=Catalinimonas alkaloidigena TaxID=1075417 RepID=UPI002404C97D|nr:ketoacyl-ACP synthase III [Catalinimonas alkaloidigena]MDF9798047.1 3-oxoacyl-[acyl-carrier-protein] synthase-3 [Catalinimonas alkaloidigena]
MIHDTYYTVISGTGRYIPSQIVKNEAFLDSEFFNASGERIPKSNDEIIRKFQQITEIEERRYVEDDMVTSDIGYYAAEAAVISAGIDKESLDYIIVAHNFGDVLHANKKTDLVPSLAARIKYKLGIQNPYTIAYDLPFGCPGWVQGLIQADYYIKSGDAKKILVIGAETLSRISDPHDIDSMIYSDGAGAVVVEAVQQESRVGVLAHKTRSDTLQHAHLLNMGVSYNPDYKDDTLFLKMEGRKLYEYALTTVPQLLSECLDKADVSLQQIKKVLIHQANAKMDDAILSRLFKLLNVPEIPEHIMPMTIATLGNNSVATVPILLDKLLRGEFEHHRVSKGDHVVFASVGAGMNVNAVVYKMP